MLFNIFINDLLTELKEENQGVNIPRLVDKLPGLLYADDLVLFASDV